MIFSNKKKGNIKLILPKRKIEPQLEITKRSIIWLFIALIYSVLTHISHIPLWVITCFPVLIIWGYNKQIKQKSILSKKVIRFIALLIIGGVLITYKTYLGKDPGIASLILLSTLKLIELKDHKDYMFMIFLTYFLLFGNFLYDQGILTMLIMITGLIISTMSILIINYGENSDIKFKNILKKVGGFLILSLPLMVVLFLFFPRFSTSFSLLDISDRSQNSGTSGFNDFMRPGSISNLVKSLKPAFTVEFKDLNKPGQKDLYFRGSILWVTDGRYWKQGRLRYRYNRKTPSEVSDHIIHFITIEPHNKHWLFTLDYPVIFPRGIRVFPGNILKTRYRIKKKIKYRIASSINPEIRNTEISFEEKDHALQLPDKWNSRISDLGLKWKREAVSNTEIVVMGLEYFKSNGFVYSLEPGIMNEDTPLEDFLFNKKKGFCEHYAATFALLMRSAGVPSRVIVGYQGGEYNEVGDYLLIRQSDAHAWTEVYLKEKGWIRVDPTETVNPERINYGADISKQLEQSNIDDKNEIIRNINKINIFKKISVYFSFYFDNLERKWDQWIIMYDRYSQIDLFKYLGFGYVRRLLIFAILIISIIIVLFFISFSIKKKNTENDPIQKAYYYFLKKVKRSGIIPHIWEGPIDLQTRLIKNNPEKKKEIKKIIDLYIQMRYGKKKDNKKLFYQFKNIIKNF